MMLWFPQISAVSSWSWAIFCYPARKEDRYKALGTLPFMHQQVHCALYNCRVQLTST